MIETSGLLQSYVRGIRSLCGAGCVSLYVPAPGSELSRPMLLHDGELEPAPELRDLELAEAFRERYDAGEVDGVSGTVDLPAAPVPSWDADCALVPLPRVRAPGALESVLDGRNDRRQQDTGTHEGAAEVGAWLGVRLPPGDGPALERLGRAPLPAVLRQAEEAGGWWTWLFELGGALASHSSQVSTILKDPLTGLPERKEFQAVLASELEKAESQEYPLSLLFVNPDDFLKVNELFGREKGDLCVQEISTRLRAALRGADLVCRYGGVIFGVILVGSSPDRAEEVAQRILTGLSEAAYLDGALRLGFSIGLSICAPEDSSVRDPLDLVRRSDQALNAAKRLGGGRVVAWREGSGAAEIGSLDRLSGIFTGNMARDYRNMVMLWDAVNVIALNPDFDQLVTQMADKLQSTFKPQRVGIFARGLAGEPSLLRGLTRLRSEGHQSRLETLELDFQQQGLISHAMADGEPRESTFSDLRIGRRPTEAGFRCYAIPLMSGKDCLGCIYLDWKADAVVLDASDLVFLKALASQLAVAMDRARLAELETRRHEWERRQLRAELNELRQAVQQAKMVFRSTEMEEVVSTARRVAATDATVLITGPSGTGKELLARTIHELSPRSKRPFVIVDCGAIPATLIESELFGHEKGAYTGAQQRRMGRLAEAHQGTVLLDEIGELPLEVQTKLLRFVQEKQLTTVGGSKSQRVDVRIVAATNRDLATEVQSGRFREDLYYRLHVIHLRVPPLEERPDDILHLARHFLEIFAVQYQKKIRGFSAEAERYLLEYPWPGNVRELQNRVMQAVILCDHDVLQPADLGIAEPPTAAAPTAGLSPPPAAGRSDTAAPTANDAGLPESDSKGDSAPATPEAILDRLRGSLGRQLDSAATNGSGTHMPLGRWLGEDLLLATERAAAGVARQAATVLGIPETTFRRRLRKAKDHQAAGMSPRPIGWEEVVQALQVLVELEPETGRDLTVVVERVLLDQIAARFPGSIRQGSALLAVSAPTYRRRLAALEQDKHAAAAD